MEHKTPHLLVDLHQVAANYQQLVAAFPGVRMHYAMKCNPTVKILECVKNHNGFFEIASLSELRDLQAIGVNPKDVLFSNPVKMASHIQAAHEAGLYRFAFDGQQELDKIARYAPGTSVYVRLSANGTNGVVPSEGKFGIDNIAAADLMVRAVSLGLKPYGITFHVGSQTLNAQKWVRAIQNAAELMTVLLEKDIKIEMLDMGGGLPASYHGDNINIPAMAEIIMKGLTKHLPYPVPHLVMEPGRALVANTGIMVTSVIGAAKRGTTHWVHLDVGAFNGMMEALESQNALLFPMTDSKQSRAKRKYAVTGPSCDSQDTILFNVELSDDLDIGDNVFIHSAGAYTTSYASNFNGFDIPATLIKPSH